MSDNGVKNTENLLFECSYSRAVLRDIMRKVELSVNQFSIGDNGVKNTEFSIGESVGTNLADN